MKHHCHWPGCQKEVPPKMWGCRKHWSSLPVVLQRKIWKAYVPGQEVNKTPSPAYLKAARQVQNWIGRNIRILNSSEVNKWMDQQRLQGDDIFPVKGKPPEGMTYGDGSKVRKPVNVAWENAVTGDRIDIQYDILAMLTGSANK